MIKKVKSYGRQYNFVKVKVKINRLLIFKILFIILLLAEVVLGVLWLLGY